MIHTRPDEMHFRQVLVLVRRRWMLVSAFVMMGAAVALAATILLVPRFTAKAQILYEMQVQGGIEVVDDAAIDTLVERLISPDHIRRLAASLASDPPVLPVAAAPDTGETAASPAAMPRLDEAALAEGLNAYKQRQSRLIAVTFTSTGPGIAATVANRAVSLYLERETQYRQKRHADKLAHLEAQMDPARASLEQAEADLRAHRIAYGLGDASGPDILDGQLGELTRQFMIVHTALEEKQEALDRLADEATADETEAEAEAEASRAQVPADAPEAPIQVSGFLPPGKSVDAGDTVRISAAIRERDVAAAQSRMIEQRLLSLRDASSKMTEAWTRLRELEREANAAGEAYESLLTSHAALLRQRDVDLPFRLITTAAVPDRPSTPDPLLFLAPVVVAAAIAGGLLAILLERLDQRLRTTQDVDAALGAPCIGLVPKLRGSTLASLSRRLCDAPFSLYTEAIRSVFVAATRQHDNERVLLVTSSARGAGTSQLALSLGLYGARLDRRILLVDFDLRQSRLSAALGADAGLRVPMTIGGYDVDKIERLRLHHLEIAGTDGADPFAMVSDGRFEAFLKEARQSFDYVVIYGAPPAEATETRLLATFADRIILTVRWAVTDVHTAWAAVQSLDGPDALPAPLSVVITEVRPRALRRKEHGRPMKARPSPMAA